MPNKFPRAKRADFTESEIRHIRKQWWGRKKKQSELAKEHGVSQPMISMIVHRQLYKQVA